MRRSESFNELAAALAKAQGEIKDASTDRENPHFKSTYATLASVWEACRAPLSKNGLSIVQSPSTTESRNIVLTTILMHSSGQWLESELTLSPTQGSPQAAGSAITYGRRYALMAIVGIAPRDDDEDDGNASSVRQPGPSLGHPTAKPPVTPQTPKPPAAEIPNRMSTLTSTMVGTAWSNALVTQYLKLRFKKERVGVLTEPEFQELLSAIKRNNPVEEIGRVTEPPEPGSDIGEEAQGDFNNFQ